MQRPGWGVLIFLTAVFFARGAHAAIPRTFTFAGSLNNTTGTPVPDGNYTVTLRLFDALTGGHAVWTEVEKNLTVAGGRGSFEVVLGDPTPFGALAFDKPLFLEVQVQGDGPMAPRLPLHSVPYALSTGGASLPLPFSGSANVASPGNVLQVSNTGNGRGIVSEAPAHTGVMGISNTWVGVWGQSSTSSGVHGESNSWVGTSGKSVTGAGLYGESLHWTGVWGQSTNSSGVHGQSDIWNGVYGRSNTGAGVFGESISSIGVIGKSTDWEGVHGESVKDKGVYGASINWVGVWGHSDTSTGVRGESVSGWGVQGESTNHDGVIGFTHNAGRAGVAAINTTNGNGLYARSDGGGWAGWFDGNVSVRVLEIRGGADLAERFETSEAAEPGMVMAIDPQNPGQLCVARGAYNRKVVGVVSGARSLSAGVILSEPGKNPDATPVAMNGRVWTLCDATSRPIEPGDFLTTSDLAGYAMAAADHTRAIGATIGKAMTGLGHGEKGLVLVLVNLQ